MYNVHSLPAGTTACAKDGGELYQRDDDKEEVIARRLDVYETQTRRPLVEHYSKKGLLRVVAGEGEFDEVFERMEAAALAQPVSPSSVKVSERAAPKRARRASLRFGYWWAGKRAPFEPVWNRELFAAVKQQVTIPVFAVGGIRTAAEVNDILDSGEADMVGIGRPCYAEPDVAAQILGNHAGDRACKNSNRCVPAQMLGMPGACYNPEVNRAVREDARR